MQRYLLVLDTDLLALDDELGQEPISYLVERQQQQPCDVTVLSVVDTSQTKLPSLELVLGGASSGIFAPTLRQHTATTEAQQSSSGPGLSLG